MANPSLQIGNNKWGIKEDNLLGYNTVGTNFLPIETTMTRASAGTRVNPQGLVKIVELLGNELVTNGDFSNGTTDWTVSNGAISIDNGRLKIDGTNGATAEQTVTAVIGKTYKVTYSFTLGTATIGALIITGGNYPTLNAPEGTNTFYTTATQTNLRVRPRIGTDGTMFVDNVSVKESTRNDLARVDYTGSVSSLLAEPQRTNLVTYSEDFTQSSWTKTGSANVTSNTIISPDGTQNADTLNIFSGSFFFTSISSGAGTFTLSCYVKVSSGTLDFKMQSFNATDGANASSTYTATTNWQRFEFTSTVTVNSNFYPIQVSGLTGGNFEIWGTQVEEGSYATSYIPTSGSTVTRVQDQYEKTGISNKINSTEGVLFAELNAGQVNDYSRYLGLSDGNTGNRVILGVGANTSNITCFISSSGTVAAFAFAVDITLTHKVALTWKLNDFKLYVNGVLRQTDTSGVTPVGLNQLSYGNGVSNSQPFLGKVKQIQVYKTALTDAELITLTTI